jgi:hypothetical protein
MKHLFLFLIIPFFLSCKPADTAKSDFLKWVKKGEINNNVVCKADQTLSYSLYLPSNYNLDTSWPVIVCFDPHGEGSLPVGLFKYIAEKKGYIVIGSNNSKNGIDANELSHIVDVLFADCKDKLMIDYKRVYLAGFSGGSRVASSVALTYGAIAGVIGCSAGFQVSEGQKPFDFIGIAGTDDMNFLEVKQLDNALNAWPTKHQFVQFDGTHKWPSKEILEQALQTLEFYGMDENRVKQDKAAVNAFKKTVLRKIQQLESTNNIDSLVNAFHLLDNTANSIKGLVDISDLLNEKKQLASKNELSNYFKNELAIENAESTVQRNYAKQYTQQNLAWWTTEITKLTKESNNGNSSLERHSCKRLLAFISLMSYSYVGSAISQQNWIDADNFCKIYGQADPENPDYYYFRACIEANTGKQKQAIESLKMVKKYGFNSFSKLNSDPLLESVRRLPEFEGLLK